MRGGGENDGNKGGKKEITLATSCKDRQSFYDREDGKESQLKNLPLLSEGFTMVCPLPRDF